MPDIFHLVVLFRLLRSRPLVDGSELPTFGNHAWVESFRHGFSYGFPITIQNEACGFNRGRIDCESRATKLSCHMRQRM